MPWCTGSQQSLAGRSFSTRQVDGDANGPHNARRAPELRENR
ncbi:hypothetical protein MMEU_0162 [Mycobacterium marinum str. Europe]|nr:hypothetical protein MMEU_0162 [Mycobacterium marinum str. Europe]